MLPTMRKSCYAEPSRRAKRTLPPWPKRLLPAAEAREAAVLANCTSSSHTKRSPQSTNTLIETNKLLRDRGQARLPPLPAQNPPGATPVLPQKKKQSQRLQVSMATKRKPEPLGTSAKRSLSLNLNPRRRLRLNPLADVKADLTVAKAKVGQLLYSPDFGPLTN